MAEMSAKYAGWCRKCGGQIRVGDKINWTKDTGANHVSCPAKTSSPATTGAPATAAVPCQPKPFVLPAIPEALDAVIATYYNDGEYCSGWSCSTATESLEKLGLGHYLSGWGWILDNAAHEALGESFTIAQAIAYAEPILRAKHDAAEAKKVAGDQKRADAFAEAGRTGQPVVLKRWSEECDGSTEECDVDNITLYAMPDGTTKKTRSHSW